MGDCALRPDDDNGAGEGDGEVEGEGGDRLLLPYCRLLRLLLRLQQQ